MYLLLTLCKEYHINAADKWYDHAHLYRLEPYPPDVVAKNNRDKKSTIID